MRTLLVVAVVLLALPALAGATAQPTASAPALAARVAKLEARTATLSATIRRLDTRLALLTGEVEHQASRIDRLHGTIAEAQGAAGVTQARLSRLCLALKQTPYMQDQDMWSLRNYLYNVSLSCS